MPRRLKKAMSIHVKGSTLASHRAKIIADCRNSHARRSGPSIGKTPSRGGWRWNEPTTITFVISSTNIGNKNTLPKMFTGRSAHNHQSTHPCPEFTDVINEAKYQKLIPIARYAARPY